MNTKDVLCILVIITFSLLAFIHIEGEISNWSPEPSQNKVILNKETDYLSLLYEKAPIMKKIAECESGDRQFYEDGSLVRGLRSADTGRFQINYVHWEKAKSMGIDLQTTQGNAEYALYLYNQKGTQPWYMSKDCWS